MSTIKKLLALVLALTMVLSATAFAGYTVVPYGDADGIAAGAEEAVQLLYSLNIMKGDNKGNFNPEATITRAEVAKMIYVVLNYGEDDLAKNYTGAKFFSDVEAGAWYEGYVNYAASIKLVQGRPDGTFGPNDPVTCAEAAKMLLTAIGYSAEARGYIGANWDKQVLSDASILGLLDGYDYNTQTYAPRQWVAVMFFNALTEALTYDTIIPTTFNSLLTGQNYGSYTTMGWKYFGLYAWEGIIVANEYADLYDDETLSSENTRIADGDDEYKFKNWTTDLTEIGEYRCGWAVEDGSKDKVVYVGGEEENTVYTSGAAENLSTDSKFKSATGLKKGGEYFKNFDESKAFSETGYGDWLRVVDNDDDGYADYVFLTEFTMAEVTKVAKDETVTLSILDEEGEKIASDEFEMSAAVAKGDIVLYTKIDGVEYVELAPSFTGVTSKYTYADGTLTVEGVDYYQSEVANKTGYPDELENVKRKTEYTFYQDFFGNIRIYVLPTEGAKDFVLLTDGYYEENRSSKIAAVDAYLDGEIKDTDVSRGSSTDWTSFIDNTGTSNNAWDKLKEYIGDEYNKNADPVGALTNLARYDLDEDGVMSLYDVITYATNKKGDTVYNSVEVDLIDLDEAEAKAGQTAYYGEYTYVEYETNDKGEYVDAAGNVTQDFDELEIKTTTPDNNVKVQTNKDTVFYYVSYPNGSPVVKTVTGYKNSYDVKENRDIRAMYAIATNVDADSEGDAYWVADVIVIETKYTVYNEGDAVVLAYNVNNKTVSDYANVSVIGEEGTDTLNVTNVNGYNTFKKAQITVLDFYLNTEDEDGESRIDKITGDWSDYGIYTATVDKENVLYDYVVTTPDAAGKTTDLEYDENTVVYDISKGTSKNTVTTEDDYEDALVLETGETYILIADDDYVVYAILVDDTITETLYDKITGDNTASQSSAIAAIKKAFKDAGLSSKDLEDDEIVVINDKTMADLLKAWSDHIDTLETEAEVEAFEADALALVPGIAETYLTAVNTPVIEAAAKAVAEITSVEVESGKWSAVKAAITKAVEAVKNVSDVTVTTTDAGFDPIAAGGVADRTVSVSYEVAGTTVEIEKTITVYVD